jgi:cytochrome c oxidase subunit 1
MHNTMWVPGHFHFYLLLGEVAMAFGFMAWLVKRRPDESFAMFGKAAFSAYVLGGIGFVLSLLFAGAASIPRRWAVHLPEWQGNGQIASIFAAVAVLGALGFLLRYLARIR